LADAIRQLASLNCSYTEMVELLQEARRANQLTSRVAINAVPRINQERFVPDEFEVVEAEAESKGFLPNLFGRKNDPESGAEELLLEPESQNRAGEASAEESDADDLLPAPLEPQSTGSGK
jgi:hypothetical protein